MKKLIVTSLATLACLGAFAQGRIGFVNDSLHMVYFSSDTSKLNVGDSSLAGRGLYKTTVLATVATGTPGIAIDLYAGTSAGSMVFVKTTSFTSTLGEGKWTIANVDLLSPNNTTSPSFFQVQIHDTRDLDAAASHAQLGHYGGISSIFTAVPQPATYNAMTQVASPVNSTWANGTFVMPTLAAGNFGAIEVYAIVPEPATFALAGLGAAALLIFRRRK